MKLNVSRRMKKGIIKKFREVRYMYNKKQLKIYEEVTCYSYYIGEH